MAEAGVTGVLKTPLLGVGDMGDMTEVDDDDDEEEKEEVLTTEETAVDLPTYDLSFDTMPGYS